MKKIFEWELPEDHPNFSSHDDLPEAYRVFKNDCAVGGVVIEARWDGHWEANPWNMRTLVRHLLEQLSEKEQSKQPDSADALTYCDFSDYKGGICPQCNNTHIKSHR